MGGGPKPGAATVFKYRLLGPTHRASDSLGLEGFRTLHFKKSCSLCDTNGQEAHLAFEERAQILEVGSLALWVTLDTDS